MQAQTELNPTKCVKTITYAAYVIHSIYSRGGIVTARRDGSKFVVYTKTFNMVAELRGDGGCEVHTFSHKGGGVSARKAVCPCEKVSELVDAVYLMFNGDDSKIKKLAEVRA